MRKRWVDICVVLALVDRQLWPSIVITIGCLIGWGSDLAFGVDAPWWRCFLYHFDHANIFHLVLNLWGLYQFKPRLKTCAVAYMVSSLVALIPFCSVTLPTCGLSGFLMAAYARAYVDKKQPIWKAIAVNMVLMLFPMFNWKIHVVSFLIAYLIWRLKRK